MVKTTASKSHVVSCKVIEVIEVKSGTGAGVAGDPCRGITEYFDKEGRLLAVYDPCADIRGEEEDNDATHQ